MGAVVEASRRGVAEELQALNHKPEGGRSQFGCLDTKFQLKLT